MKENIIYDKQWGLLNSFWMLTPLTLFFSGVQLIYIGRKVNKNLWTILGAISVAAIWILMIINLDFGANAVIILFFANVIFDFVIRKEYLIRLKALEDSKLPTKEEMMYERIKMEYSSKDESIEDIEIIEPEAEVNKAVEEINNLRTSGVKKEEVKVEYNNNSNLIDINSMDEDEIMKECGTNIVLAKRVIRYRNEKGSFKNVDEFLELLSLPNSRREELKRRLKVKEEKRNTDYRQSRIVDF